MRLPLNRRRLSTLTEPIVEGIIRICGWSAIVFVFAIFFFVLREGAPVLFGILDIKEFNRVNWRPDSTIRPRFGILALLAGTASVTALAMIISVPAGFGAANFMLYGISNVGKLDGAAMDPLLELVPGAIAGSVIAFVFGRSDASLVVRRVT